jgi:Protein of unknown function (DUF4232)
MGTSQEAERSLLARVPVVVWHRTIAVCAGLALLLAACSTSPRTLTKQTTTTTRVQVILKAGGDACGTWLRYAETHPGVPDVDSVIAASCTSTELRAAIASEHLSLTPQQVAVQETATAGAACSGNPHLKLCGAGTPTIPSGTTSSGTTCLASHLQLTLDRVVPGLDQQPGAFFRLTDTSGAPCTLDGYPTLQPITPSGQVVGAAVRNGPSYQIGDPGPSPVVLAPGGSAYFGYGWSDVTHPEGSPIGCVNAVPVTSVPPRSETPLEATAQLPSVCPAGYPSVTAVAAQSAFAAAGSPASP